MYQLNCPYCKFKLDSPFVRAGAVVVCQKCAQKYQIKSHHLRRNVKVPALQDETPLKAVLPAHAMMAAMAAAADTERQQVQPEHAPNSTELKASESGQSATTVAQTPNDASAQEQDESSSAMDSLPPALRELTKFRPKQKSMLLSAGIIGGLATIGLVVLLVVLFSGGNGGDPSTDGEASTGGETTGSIDPPEPELRVINPVELIELKKTIWNAPKPGKARFQPSTSLTSLHLGKSKVIDDGSGGLNLQAQVINEKSTAVSWATMQISLVNLDRRVYNTRNVFVGLVPGDNGTDGPNSTKVVMPLLPSQLRNLAEFEVRFINLGPRLRGWQHLSKKSLEKPELLVVSSDTVLKISGRNPTTKLYQQANFVITGKKPGGKIIGRWGVRYNTAIKPSSKFEFGVKMPFDRVSNKTIWEVDGAAGAELSR